MTGIKYILMLIISFLLLSCASSPITGKKELLSFSAHLVECNRDPNFNDIFYLKMIIGDYASKNKIQSIIFYECDKIANQYGYNLYEVIDDNIVDEGLYRYHIIEVQFHKNKPYNPCADEIFEIVERKGIRNLTDREFEIYKLKSEECNEFKKKHELKKQKTIEKKQKSNQTQALWAIVLILLLFYAYGG